MNLRTKLTFGMAGILLTSLLLSAALTVYGSFGTAKKEAAFHTENELEQLQKIIKSKSGLTDQLKEEQSDIVKDALFKYIFRSSVAFFDGESEFVLQKGNQNIVNNSGVSPAAVIRAGKGRQTDGVRTEENMCAFARMGKRDYCVTCYEQEYGGTVYHIAAVRDMTDSMDRVRGLALVCLLLDAVISFLAVIVLGAFMKKSFQPLGQLEEAASLIAGGEYGRRTGIQRKDEIGALAQRFDRMAEAVERHIRKTEEKVEEQKMLISAISHEMRTPVTAITGYAYALKSGKLNEVQTAEAVDFIDSESRRLERLSTKLSSLISTEHGKWEMQDVKMAGLLHEVCRLMEPKAEKAGAEIEIKAEEPAAVSGERDLLTALLINLVDNALKAGASQIEIGFADAVLWVEDNGRGIAGEELDKIAMPFYQGDVSRNSEGFGLGLSLCQNIVQLHGAAFYVGSKVHEGTMFAVKFKECDAAHFSSFLHLHDDFKMRNCHTGNRR